jgi:exonuclease SbcC
MIKKVVLRNWKCHLESEFEFCEGTNCLLGIMGAGKTSVLDAICFALFGTFPHLQQKRVKLDEVIMKKPTQQQKAEVRVTFEVDGDEYVVIRKIERKKGSSAELRKNGELIEVQPQRVNETIEKILKIDYDLFTRAIYSEQNRLDLFLTIPKGQRMRKIDELLRLDKFENARSSVVSLINKVKAARDEAEKILESLESESDVKNVEVIEKQVEECEKKIKGLTREMEEIEKEIKERTENFEKLKAIKEKTLQLEKDYERALALKMRLESEIKSLEEKFRGKSVERIKNELSTVEKECEAFQKKIQELEITLDKERKELEKAKIKKVEIERMEKELELLEKRKKQIENWLKEKDVKKTKEELEVVEKELTDIREKIYEFKIYIQEAEKSLKELEKVEGKCPICEAKLDEQRRTEIIERKKKLIKGFLDEKRKSEEKLEKLEKRYRELKKVLEEISRFEIELHELEKRIERAKEIIKEKEAVEKACAEIEKIVRKNEKDLKEFRSFLEKKTVERERLRFDLESLKELEEKKKELKKKTNECLLLEKRKDELQKVFSEEKFEKLEKQIKELFAREREIKAKIESEKLIMEEKRKRLEEIRKKLKLIEDYKAEVNKLSWLKEQLEKLKACLITTQEELRKNFVAAINHTMHTIWEELYPYGDFQSIRLFVDEGDYVLQLQELDGRWVSVDNVSGGERSLAALTLRIAFALVLAPQLKWLVLDEPTHNLDANAKEELARILRERITEFIDQVFLITHDPILENAVSGYLYKLERDKAKNGWVKVVRVSE